MQKNINGATFRKMIIAGGKVLEENRSYVDSLNVFPVPDPPIITFKYGEKSNV